MTKSKNLDAKRELFWNKGMQSYSDHNYPDAVRNFKLYLKYDLTSFMGYYRLAMAFHGQSSLDEAIKCYNRAIELNPSFPDAFCDRGVALAEIGRTADALEDYGRATELDKNYAEAYYNKGIALLGLNRHEEAVSCFKRAIFIKQVYPWAAINLGNALSLLSRYEEALSVFRTLIKEQPGFAAAHFNMGNCLVEMKRFDEALTSYESAIKFEPEISEFSFNYANTLVKTHRYEEAVASYAKAVSLDPKKSSAWNNLGKTYLDIRNFESAKNAFQSAIKLDEPNFVALNNFIFTQLYMIDTSAIDLLAQARVFGRLASKAASVKYTNHKASRSTPKIRLGLVSGDFRQHSVSYFLEGVVAHLDPNKTEIFAYANNLDDEVTLRIKRSCIAYRNVIELNDASLAQLIHSDEIQILIDLSGHSALNRLPIFTYKPAPIQISWIGYCGTTGISEMDYILGDSITIPVDQEHHFCEKILRMPSSYLCYTIPNVDAPIKTLPANANGFITFGSFNNFSKVNNHVLFLWARILNSVSGSHLILKSSQLESDYLKNQIVKFFMSRGIEPNRLRLEGKKNQADHFETYNQVDIALDPFPYQGVTTTIEALWMGVPVLTKKGNSFISNHGEMISHFSGQADWVATDEEDYLMKAIQFSSDISNLTQIRSVLRQKILGSILVDSERFALQFQDILQKIWNNHINAQNRSTL